MIALPGGTKKEFEYDPLMRIKKITSLDPGQNVLLNYQYSYDKMDNIRTKATEHSNYSYNYDDLYRLTDDRRPMTAESYKYDEVGNRLTSVSGTTVNWNYNQNNELQSYDGVTFQYDANGNTIQKITDNGQLMTDDYTYDIENRLITVTRFTSGVSPFIVTYEYDPFGRRLWKEVDGNKTYFVYCDEGLAAELDQNGSLTKAYGYRPNSTWTTNPIFMREEESYYYYHNDHLGTPQKLTAQNGQVVWSAKYAAFGEAEIDPASTITNNLRFPGQYYDSETSLHYNWNRYYDTRSGRYIMADLIGLGGGVNLFVYVENNPMIWIDIFGFEPENDESIYNINPGIYERESEAFNIRQNLPRHIYVPNQFNFRDLRPMMNKYVLPPDLDIIQKLQCIANRLSVVLTISSGYRYPVGSSEHERGRAADIIPPRSDYRSLCQFKQIASSCGFTRVCYSLAHGHIHADTGAGTQDCEIWTKKHIEGGPYRDPCDLPKCLKKVRN